MTKVVEDRSQEILDSSWQDVLQDISEVARTCLHSLISTNTPPLPKCYEREFLNAADSLRKDTVLRLIRQDQHEVASRIKEIIHGARHRLSEAQKIFSDFEKDARHNISLLDEKLREMHGALLESGIGTAKDISGHLDAIKDTNESFLESVKNVLDNVAKQERLLSDLARKVNEDALTGCLNRRAWDQDIQDLDSGIKERPEKGGTFSIIMIDLDHFKRVNDSYGHPVGDALLRQFAKLLKDHFASSGSVYRYGGEEFAVILPGMGLEEAGQLAEAFRMRMNKSLFLVNREGLKLKITASFGVAQWEAGEDAADVVRRADRLLYSAKEQGRNIVMS